MAIFYETVENDGGIFPLIVAHDTFEAAAEYAEAHGLRIIEENGGAYTTFERCRKCGEWFDTNVLNTDGTCERCN